MLFSASFLKIDNCCLLLFLPLTSIYLFRSKLSLSPCLLLTSGPRESRTFSERRSSSPSLCASHDKYRTLSLFPNELPHSRTPPRRTGDQTVRVCVYIKGGTSASVKQIEGPVRDCTVRHVCVLYFYFFEESKRNSSLRLPLLLLRRRAQCSHTSMSVTNSSAYRSERSFHQTSSSSTSSSTSSSSTNPHMEKSRGLFAEDFGSFMRPGSDALGFSSKLGGASGLFNFEG